jgi:hypothetical protein
MYQSRGTAFILVSFGRDNKPDGIDYWKMREINEQDSEKRLTCYHPNADQVISDLGIHRACFK